MVCMCMGKNGSLLAFGEEKIWFTFSAGHLCFFDNEKVIAND